MKKTKTTKVAKTTSNEVAPAPTKKKKHVGLILLCVFLTVFILFPIVFVFGAFYDTSTKEKLPTDPIKYENLVTNAVRTGMKNVKEEKALSLHLNEEMLDGVMLYACDQLGTKYNAKDYIPKMYCEIHGREYTFYAELQVSFFKSRLALQTTMEEQVINNEKTLVFKINKVILGRLPIPANWIASIAGNFITDTTIEEAFSNTGFHFKCDLKNLQVTYTRSAFQEDVAILLSDFSSNNPFVNILLEIFADDRILNINFDNEVNAKFNLLPLSANANYPTSKEDKHYFQFTDLDNHRTKIEEWYNEGLINDTTAPKLFNYLIRGSFTNEADRNWLKNTTELKNRVTEYTRNDIDSYKGSTTKGEERFADLAISNLTELIGEDIEWISNIPTPPLPQTLKIFEISNIAINKYVASLDGIIGKTFLITANEEGEPYSTSYITIDNLFVDFNSANKEMLIYLGLNVNGFSTTMIVPTKLPTKVDRTSGSGKLGYLNFNLERNSDDSYKIFFGEVAAPKSAQDYLFEMLKFEGNESFKFDKSKGCFTFELDGAFPASQVALKTAIINLMEQGESMVKQSFNIDDNHLIFNLDRAQ